MQICKLCKSEVAETCLRHLGCKIAQDVSFPPRRAKRDREKGRKKTAKTKWCHLKNNIQNFNLVVESWQQHFLQTRRFNFGNKVKRAYGVIRRHLHNHWTYFSTILIGRRIIRYRLMPTVPIPYSSACHVYRLWSRDLNAIKGLLTNNMKSMSWSFSLCIGFY